MEVFGRGRYLMILRSFAMGGICMCREIFRFNDVMSTFNIRCFTDVFTDNRAGD
jgi:hypothetical protein